MADNLAVTAGSGSTIGMDEITDGVLGTVKVGFGKIMDGTLDSSNKLIINSSGEALVKQTSALPAGTAVIGHVIMDSGSTTVVTGTVTANATLSAETTKVIGVIRTADGSGNLLTSTTNALDINIKSGNLTTLPVTNAGTFAVQDTVLDAAIISQEATTSGVKGLTGFGAVTTAKPTYVTGKSDALSLDVNGLLRISLADTPANGTKLLVTPDSVALPANQSVNVSQINGVTPLMGTGIMGTGSPRVTIASDNDPLTVKQATAGNLNATVVGTGTFAVQATLSAETTKVIGVTRTSDGAGNLLTTNSTTPSGKFAIDQNITSILGTAPTTVGKLDVKGADGDVFVRQATGSNLHTVIDSGTITTVSTLTGITNTVVTDDLAAAPTGAAVPSNAQYQGTLAQTALPAAGSAGNLTGSLGDKFGRMVVLNNAMRDIMGTQTTTIAASTTETTIITAVASTFLDLISVFISNTSATAARVDIRDTTGGSIIFQLYIPAGDMRGLSLTTPWPQSAVNTNWTAQSSTSVTDLRVSALYIKNK